MHPTMFPDPDFGEMMIDGESFTLMDGVVGLGFSPNLGLLYYQPLATDRIYSIATSILRKGPLAENEALAVQLVGKKSSQGLGLAVDPRDDTVYFSPLTETSLASWSPKTNQQKLVFYENHYQCNTGCLYTQHTSNTVAIQFLSNLNRQFHALKQ